jgi:hypothetical protein
MRILELHSIRAVLLLQSLDLYSLRQNSGINPKWPCVRFLVDEALRNRFLFRVTLRSTWLVINPILLHTHLSQHSEMYDSPNHSALCVFKLAASSPIQQVAGYSHFLTTLKPSLHLLLGLLNYNFQDASTSKLLLRFMPLLFSTPVGCLVHFQLVSLTTIMMLDESHALLLDA